MAKVSVIIQNADGQAHIEACLRSVRAQSFGDFDIIVVDHGSMDESPNIVAERFPEATLYLIGQGKGAAYGIQYAVSRTDSTYVALLDSTVTVHPQWLAELVSALEVNPKAFSAASKILRAGDHAVVESCGLSLTLSGALRQNGRGKSAERRKKNKFVFSASARAALYHRGVLGVAGGFDEVFYTYADDADVAYRALLCGYRTVLCHRAEAYSSAGEAEYLLPLLEGRNRIFMLYKNMPWLLRMLNLPAGACYLRRRKRFYARLGQLHLLRAGIREGHKNKKRLCANKRHKRPLRRHLKAQWLLFAASLKGLFTR